MEKVIKFVYDDNQLIGGKATSYPALHRDIIIRLYEHDSEVMVVCSGLTQADLASNAQLKAIFDHMVVALLDQNGINAKNSAKLSDSSDVTAHTALGTQPSPESLNLERVAPPDLEQLIQALVVAYTALSTDDQRSRLAWGECFKHIEALAEYAIAQNKALEDARRVLYSGLYTVHTEHIQNLARAALQYLDPLFKG